MKTSATPSATARARLGLIVSMTVFGTIGLFVRRIEITSAELALCRAGLAAVFLLLSFLVTRRRLCLSEIKKSLWLLLASGAAMGINWMLLFEAYQYTTISLATLSYYLAPVLVTALCPLLFHEKMTRTQVLCFLVSTLGVALIIGSGSMHGGASDVRGICFGVSAAVFYAAVILLNKYITGVPALERTFVQFLAAILVLAPEYLRAFSEYRMLLFGAVMVIMMIYRPQGLISGEKRTYKITNKDKIDSSKSAFDVPATGGQA